MRDPTHIVAEMRAVDLFNALQAALNGDAHWRIRAAVLLREITTLEPMEALREIEARKRAASSDGKAA